MKRGEGKQMLAFLMSFSPIFRFRLEMRPAIGSFNTPEILIYPTILWARVSHIQHELWQNK